MSAAPAIEVRERPILFSGPMVRAILDGRKTQTRRVVDERQRIGYPSHEIESASLDCFTTTGGLAFNWGCPYGEPGDRLWVREKCFTWTEFIRTESRVYQNDRAVYAADGYTLMYPANWRPSIHMPRWASRITLEITEVRVQRVQDISEDDAQAEGVPNNHSCKWPCGDPGNCYDVYARNFANLWDSINAKREGGKYAWNANPWIWALTFRRLSA